MNYYFSPSKNTFIPLALEKQYRLADTMPSDCIPVSDEVAGEYMGNAPEGKLRVSGKDGLPVWNDLPLPTHEQLVAQAEAKRQSLLSEASSITDDWRVELSLGIISDQDKIKLTDWMHYIQSVKAVDVSTVPEVSWPEQPGA